MTALEKLEAALREHAKETAAYYRRQDANAAAAKKRWAAKMEAMGLAPDGELYAAKRARSAAVQAAKRRGG